jgi:hypothetical protein
MPMLAGNTAPAGWTLLLALAGCHGETQRDGHDASGGSSAATEPDSGTASEGVASTGLGTGPLEDGSSGTGEHTTEGASEGSTGDVALQRCGIADLAPGASNPLVASDREPMQLPTEIADILTRSCGCHLADDIVIPGDYPAAGTLDLTTWQSWQIDYGSVPTYEAARKRLDPEIPELVMPPGQCDVGAGETMLPEDRARLLEWVVALAPDGVTWSAG